MKEICIEDFLDYKFLSDVSVSPGGDYAAFVVKEAKGEEEYGSNIWIYDFGKEDLLQLTCSGKDQGVTWRENGEDLLFVSGRKKDDDEEGTDVYQISVKGGEARKLLSLSREISEMKLAGNKLVYKAPVDISEEGKEDEEEEDGDYVVFDEIPFWANGKGITNKKREHLFVKDLEEGEEEELTPNALQVEEYDVSEGRAVFVGAKFVDKFPVSNAVYSVDLEGEKPEKLTGKEWNFDLVQFIEEDRAVVSASDMEEYGLNQNKKLYGLDITRGEVTPLTPGRDKSIGNSVLTDVRLGGGRRSAVDGDKFYFVSTEGSSSYLDRIDREGNEERVVSEEGTVDFFDAEDGRVVYVSLRENRPQEVYTRGEKEEKRITYLNEEPLSDKAVQNPEPFSVEREGVEIDAWIMKPKGFRQGEEYPTILEIHGGPKAAYSPQFFHEMQLLAGRGYAVVFSNPRGSSGKGNEFADIREEFGRTDYEDLMAVVDESVERFEFIDEEKLGVTGGSYGGYMTNWIIGQTDRFEAAVSQRSISNWISKFNTTDIGYFFVEDQQGSTPWEDYELLWDQSPLQFADRASTPTLFIHAKEDYRCWMAEALQMFTALKYQGVESRLCLFEGENHELSRGGKPENRKARLREMVDWFDKYLKEE